MAIEYDYDIPDNYIKAIGLVTVSWARLDYCIDFLIWELLGLQDDEIKGLSVTNHLSFPMKYNIVSSLLEIWLSETSKIDVYNSIIETLDNADILRVKRNDFSHGAWQFKNNHLTSIKFSARGTLKADGISYKLEDIETLINDIQNCYDKLLKLTKSIETLPSSFLDRFSRLIRPSRQNQDQNQ